ncbi:uncharacterized protein [Nicotiana sylvestris]|uniref:uncharacterized protein n=1 Tax=Nicotiana sylvestris TaxID=4096 RepID=UPI00388CE468
MLVEKVPEGKYIPNPKITAASVRVAFEILKNGFDPGKGLGSSLQGIIQPVSLPKNLGTFGLGFKPTTTYIKRSRKLKQRAWVLPKQVPLLSRSFVMSGTRSRPVRPIPSSMIDPNKELIEKFEKLFDDVNMVEIGKEVEGDDESEYDEDEAFEVISKELNHFEGRPKPNLNDTEAINLGDTDNIIKNKISVHLKPKIREEIIKALIKYKDIFAWSYDDMPGLSTDLVVRKLATDPTFPPVKQKLRKFKTDMSVKIKEEITEQLDAKVIRVTRYPIWLANVVLVPEKDGKIRVCVDYRNLNKASPKDNFPLPNIHILIDNCVKHEIGSFVDCYAGYHQILMDEEDAEKTIKLMLILYIFKSEISMLTVTWWKKNLMAPWPFVAWGMDVIGPIEPAASNEHRFIMVAIDYFTKWVEAKTLKSVTKKAMVDFVHSNIICRFGIPKAIVTDNGANLNSNLMKEVCQQFKITHRNSTPYRPKENRAAEAANKNIKKILRKMVEVGATPYLLVYGTEVVILAEVEIPSLWIVAEAEIEDDEWVKTRLEQLSFIDEKRLEAVCHGQLYQKRMARAYNKKVHPRKFEVGAKISFVSKKSYVKKEQAPSRCSSEEQGRTTRMLKIKSSSGSSTNMALNNANDRLGNVITGEEVDDLEKDKVPLGPQGQRRGRNANANPNDNIPDPPPVPPRVAPRVGTSQALQIKMPTNISRGS